MACEKADYNSKYLSKRMSVIAKSDWQQILTRPNFAKQNLGGCSSFLTTQRRKQLASFVEKIGIWKEQIIKKLIAVVAGVSDIEEGNLLGGEDLAGKAGLPDPRKKNRNLIPGFWILPA